MQSDNQDEDGESEDILTISTKKFGLTPSKSRKTSGPFKTLPTPAKSSQPAGFSLGLYCLTVSGTLLIFISAVDDDSEDDPFQSASRSRSTQKGRLFGAGINRGHEDSSEGSAPEDPVITPSKRKRNTPKSKGRTPINVESEDEDEIPIGSSRGRAARSSTSKPRPKSITISNDSEDTAENDSEVSEIMSHSSWNIPKPPVWTNTNRK
jgi:hypothetical protein